MTLLTSCAAHAPTRANRMMQNAFLLFVPLPLPVRHPTHTINHHPFQIRSPYMLRAFSLIQISISLLKSVRK